MLLRLAQVLVDHRDHVDRYAGMAPYQRGKVGAIPADLGDLLDWLVQWALNVANRDVVHLALTRNAVRLSQSAVDLVIFAHLESSRYSQAIPSRSRSSAGR